MPSDDPSNILRELRRELRELEARNELRHLACLSGVNLCSNDYLGLSAHPLLREAVLEAVRDAARLGATGSRLLSGNAPEWQALEEEFAAFAGTPAALYFNSAYAASVGLLGALLDKNDDVFSDERNHASLIDGMRLSGARKTVYPHLDLDALEAALRRCPAAGRRRLIVTESVFSMDGDRAPLEEIVQLAERYAAGVIVDEAHATGVYGPEGRGLVALLRLESRVLAVVHACGKALASAGGFVCGSAVLVQFLVNRARTFIFSTAMPPYLARQIQTALRLARAAESERRQLLSAAARFAAALEAEGFDTGASASQIVPVILGENEIALRVAAHLRDDGFAVRAIRPPTVAPGQARLRLSFTARIREEEYRRLAGSLLAARSLCAAHAAAGSL